VRDHSITGYDYDPASAALVRRNAAMPPLQAAPNP